jgi:hypothetical protein
MDFRHFIRRADRSWRVVLCALAVLALLPGLLGAHAFWPTFHSAKTAVSLGADGLQAAVVLEVPTNRLVADFKAHFADVDLVAEIEAGRFAGLEDTFREHQFAAFVETLDLEVDGVPAVGRWRPVDTPINGMGTEGFFVYMFEFAFDTPPTLGEKIDVRLVTRAFAGEEVVMANVAEVHDGWQVASSSIPPPEEYELPEGAELEDPEIGLWTIDEDKRDLRVSFERSLP